MTPELRLEEVVLLAVLLLEDTATAVLEVAAAAVILLLELAEEAELDLFVELVFLRLLVVEYSYVPKKEGILSN